MDIPEPTFKPPLGIEPEYIWKQKRMFALIECIARYSTSGLSVNDIWLVELGDLIAELCPYKKGTF
jgi:hypothetical protein